MNDKRACLDINEIFDLFTFSYTIPIEFRDIVKTAINRYAQPYKHSKETLNRMVNKATSPLDTFKYLGTKKEYQFNYSQWKGHLAEWIVCYEYNSIRNNGNVVFTFLNPDSSSKADILHIIKVGERYKYIAGPDIKTGQAAYLINQLEKVWSHEGSIPFYDFYNILSDEKKLTKKHIFKLNQLKENYPQKVILTPNFNSEEILKFSNKFLRRVANQQTGPTASAVKKARQYARDTIPKKREWTAFNYDAHLKYSFEKQQETIRRNAELKAQKLLEEVMKRNRSAPVNKKSKPMEWLAEMGTKIAKSKPVKFVKDHPEIIEPFIVVTGEVLRSALRVSKSSKTSGIEQKDVKSPLTDHVPQSKINEEFTRKSPVKHPVTSYTRKDGTPVRGYLRGKD
ncbi:hypothetical protein NST77_23395 [Niallia sp. FSL W8-0177]|uniref:hypothetical protein n=1 Tax=Niallia sp. FSL W8-0177 TaxID=2954522 RepID=UPI0030F93A2A